jgi:hypothetical protein
MADHSKVDIDALAAFGKALAFGDHPMAGDFGDGVKKTMSISQAQVGFSGTNEAQVFRDYYYHVVAYSWGQFQQDIYKGLLSMGCGAVVEAANYREGDLSQAQALHDVQAAFNPARGTQSVASYLAAAADKQKAEDAKVRQLLQKAGEDHLPPPTKSAPPTDPKPAPSAMEQVRIHDDRYLKDEHWTPEDPNAPDPNVKILAPGPLGGGPDTSPVTNA